MKKRIILLSVIALLFFFCFRGHVTGISFDDTNKIIQFKITEIHLGKHGGKVVLSYNVKKNIHIYVNSKIANVLTFKFLNKNINIDKIDYSNLINKDNESYIQGNGTITLFLSGKLPLKGSVTINYQGCSGNQCFIPDSIRIEFSSDKYENVKLTHKKKRIDKLLLSLIKNNIKNPLFAMLLVFIAGFLTSLTPCVYPMIPITISYFGRRAEGQKMKSSFVESILYVLGLSITYTVLGIVAALTGSAFGSLTQNPILLTTFAGLFFLMAFMMCDYLPLPGISLAAGAQGKVIQKRSFFQPMLLGLITGLVASPCVGPVVLFLLTLIMSTGSIFYGALLMFVFSLGLGVIFVIIGTFSGLINKLPKAGKWMETVEVIFSILMVIVAAYFLNLGLKGFKIFGAPFISLGFAIMFTTFFLGLFSEKPFVEKDPLKKKKYQMVFFILMLIFLIGFSFMLKGIIYKKDMITAISKERSQSSLVWHSDLNKGIELAKKMHKPIFLDFGADWCAVCKEFESAGDNDAELQQILTNYILVRLSYDDNKELAKNKFKVMGLPTFIILDENGKVLHRESGFLSLKAFVKDLEEITNELLPHYSNSSK